MTSSQSRSITMENTMVKETLFNEEFIGYINSLSRAILNYYKVSINIHSNKDLLINYGKSELINQQNKININDGNILNNALIELNQSLGDIFNKLDFNNKSQEKNLSNFFSDAKILFKRLREKRQEIISKIQLYTQRSKISHITGSSKNSNKRNKTLEHKNNELMAKSYHNINLNQMENDIMGSDFSKNKSVNLTEENGMILNEVERRKSQKRLNPTINDEYFQNNNTNIINSVSEFGIKTPNLNNMNNINNRMKQMNLINKKYSSDFSQNSKKGLNNPNMNTTNFKNINNLIRDKDNIISTLKEEINNLNKKHQLILNKYKKELSNLKIMQLKSNNNINNPNDINNKENNILRNKIKILENKYNQKQAENLELNKKINLLQNQYGKNNGQQFEQNDYTNNNINLNGQISALNDTIRAKDEKLIEINYQLEQIQSEFLSKEAENKKLLKLIENMKLNKEKNMNKNNNINILNEKLEEQQNLNNDLNEELSKVKNDNELLKNKILSNEKRISLLKQNCDLLDIKEKDNEKLKNENKSLKFENEKLNYNYTQLKENFISKDEDKTKKQEDEIEGLKQLVQKMQTERENCDKEISSLKRENEKVKNQMMKLSKTLPEEYNELQKQYNELENKYTSLKNKNPSSTTPKKIKSEEKLDENKYAKELTEAKKEIEQLKKKNVDLVTQLEDKEINKNYYDTRSEDANRSNYEEEFDLRKMAKGAKDKNRSQDINIDYPGILTYKEKLRELEFYYNSLETLVKKLLLTIQCTPKNTTYVTELCRIVGFDLETTNKIVNNKNKNFILGLFSK